MKNKIDEQYLKLLSDILQNGVVKKDRTGVGTKSVFGRQIRFDMSGNEFPLITSKQLHTKSIIHELLWFLNGDTNIKYLVDNGVNIWNGDAWKNYQKKTEGSDNAYKTKEEFIEAIKGKDEAFIRLWGNLGPIYGRQWRHWGIPNKVDVEKGEFFIGNTWIDQIKNLVHDLKNNPDSRRLMVSAWNVAELEDMVLPPCHYSFQCYTRELTVMERYDYAIDILKYNGLEDYGHTSYEDDKILEYLNINKIPARKLSLMWNQRSVDTFLGLPFNIASYAFLLSMLAQQVNMLTGELIGNFGDTHLYLNHLSQAEQQLYAQTFELPQLNLNKAKDIFSYSYKDFKIENYKFSPTIKATLNN